MSRAPPQRHWRSYGNDPGANPVTARATYCWCESHFIEA